MDGWMDGFVKEKGSLNLFHRAKFPLSWPFILSWLIESIHSNEHVLAIWQFASIIIVTYRQTTYRDHF